MVKGDYFIGKQNAEMPEEFGFHFSRNMKEVRNAVAVLELFNKWPDEGGYLDQDAQLIADMLMYKRLVAWEQDQHKPKGDENNGGE
jgi:hypothetical protein